MDLTDGFGVDTRGVQGRGRGWGGGGGCGMGKKGPKP